MKPVNLERETMTPRRRGKRAIVVLTALAACLLVAGFVEAAVDTTTEITFSAGPCVVGASVTVKWTVTAQTTSAVVFGGNPLTRKITSPGGTPGDVLDDAAVTSGASSFTSTHPFIPTKAGTYTVEGDYAGCAGCIPPLNASSSVPDPVLLVVGKANTTTAVSVDVNPSVTGQTVTFTATVADDPAGTGVPTGSVTFEIEDKNGTGIVTASVALSGDPATATYGTALMKASLSKYEVTASYDGIVDPNYNGSDGTLAGGQQVDEASTTTAVSADVDPSVTGETVTFTATVTADAPGTGTPTGNVTFQISTRLTR